MSRTEYRFGRTSRNVCMPAAGGPKVLRRGGFVVTKSFAGAGRLSVNFLNWRRGVAVAMLCGLSIGLAGCESGSSIFGAGPDAQPQAQLVPSKPAAVQTRVAIAPVIGAPDGVAKQLSQDFNAAIAQNNVRVVGAQDSTDYTVRGYVVAAKDKAAVKVSYIWDVTDPQGRRVNRITGEEVIAGAAVADAWSAVTAPVSQSIAKKSADSLATWMTAQVPSGAAVAAATQTAPASSPAAPTGVGATAPLPATAPTVVSALPPAAPAPAEPPQRTAAAAPAPLGAVVPTLSGAPGDGNNLLAKALQSELSKNGVGPTGQTGSLYRVEGIVKMGAVADGKQPVQIDWNVKDPQGKRVGTVTQKNEIAAGSLDGSWGRTADAAAAAAAQGILKLLPHNTAAN